MVLLVTLASWFGLAGPAAAHNVLISSDPAEGATLQAAPAVVRLTFDQPVQDFQPVVTVIGPDNQRYESGPPAIDSTVVTAPVAGLSAAGPYVIAYRVVSADGHPVEGEVHFQLAEAAPTDSTPAEPAPASGTGAGSASAAAAATSAPGGPTSGGPVSGGTPSGGSAGTSGSIVATNGTPAAGAQSSGSGLSGWVWAAIAVAAILIVAAVVVIVRRPRQPE